MVINYKRYVYNDTSLEYDNNGFLLKITTCNDNLVPDLKFSKGKNLSEWTCLDFPSEGLKFGGSWSTNFVNYFNIFFLNSTNVEDTATFLNSDDGQYFSMYYPTFYFLPNNVTHPQNIKYENYYTMLSPSISKTDRMYLKSYILDDDVGWIFKNTKSSSVIAFDRMESHFEINDFTS